MGHFSVHMLREHSGVWSTFQLTSGHFSTIKNTQFSTSLDERDPDLVEETELNPTLERAMDRTIVREVSGELIPLTPATEPEDDGIGDRAGIDASAPCGLGRV